MIGSTPRTGRESRTNNAIVDNVVAINCTLTGGRIFRFPNVVRSIAQYEIKSYFRMDHRRRTFDPWPFNTRPENIVQKPLLIVRGKWRTPRLQLCFSQINADVARRG